ncbi:HEAT repeat domain-containing protein [Streptomyces sp. SP18CS02]|uniref:HEAT repeat domain-containing protein n=1 Tax=Streptomyces sp. SP18CS02 TaxID=3002531 RepID=UPI002E761F3C|nr:HEAT repeat domain-containing protein [Streptomyces sp. SP18CS02]MEE1752205.1 HEAT repeat domain-containing protein [Streptomyces sp. SP18CS02]
MELAHPLDGLDAQPWGDTSHAYGSADDLPDLLRVLADGGPDAVEEAVSELYGRILHQGTVYPASAVVVPFLARLAAAGHATADVLTLLGGLAESEDECDVEPGAVRAAVAAGLPLILPLLSDRDSAVRQAAAWAAGQTRDEAVPPALRELWERERVPLVRAELLGVLARLDGPGAVALAEEALDPAQAPHLRLAAVFACLDGGVPWSQVHHDAVLSLLPVNPLVLKRLDVGRTEPLYAVVAALLERDTDTDRAAVAALLDPALRDGREDVRAEALWAADLACRRSRGLPGALLPALLALAADPATVGEVLPLLTLLGPAAAGAAPTLLDAADGEGDPADAALAALAAVAPHRAAVLLARHLADRPRALDAAAGFMAPADSVFPFNAELLHAVRVRLAAAEPRPEEPLQLMNLLAQWRGQAAPALPELYAVLPRFPERAAGTVAAVAADGPAGEREHAAGVLRAASADGSLPVARALHELTGESAALLPVLGRRLESGGPELVGEAARTAAGLGPAASPLLDALANALSVPRPDGFTTSSELDADVAVAEALWRITGQADAVLPVLDSVFDRADGEPWFAWSAIRAARAAALLGPAARPLVPRLERLLDDPEQTATAVLALVAAEPDSSHRSALAEAALRSAETRADPMGACDALEALGGTALTADHVRRLTVLAEGDARVTGTVLDHEVVHADDRLRARLREVLAAL